MTTSSFSPSTAGWVSIATGVTGLFAIAFTILFFTVGAPFGSLNDAGNGQLPPACGKLLSISPPPGPAA